MIEACLRPVSCSHEPCQNNHPQCKCPVQESVVEHQASLRGTRLYLFMPWRQSGIAILAVRVTRRAGLGSFSGII